MSEKLHITLVQADLEWNSPETNRQHLKGLLNKTTETDIIVLPELFATAFCMEGVAEEMMGQSMQWMHALAKEKKAAICGSLIIQENGKQFNRFIWMSPDGVVEHYDKRHLFSLLSEEEQFAAGRERKIITYKGWKICPQICYDLRFPVFSRNDSGYDLLMYVANWPERRIVAWDKLLQARAIENQSYVIGVNRVGADASDVLFTGHSAVYDAFGETITLLGEQEKVKTVVLEKVKQDEIRANLPFLKDGDDFTLSK